MARTFPALLAAASLFASCRWCSGEAQDLENSFDVEEITVEAEVGLLQVKGNLMPRSHAASSDAVWSMSANPSAPVAFPRAFGSTRASPPSAPVLLACLSTGVAVAGLLSVVLLREIYLHWRPSKAAGKISVRFMHVAAVSNSTLDAAKYSSFIPLALDVASEMGWSPAVSSMLIGSFCTGRFVGNVLARVFQPLLGHYLVRQVAMAAVALTAVMEVLVCVPVLLQPTSCLHGYLILGLRLLSGLLAGLATMADVIVRKCTPESEQTPFSLSIGIAVSVGMLIGPLISTLVLKCLGQQHRSMEASDKMAAMILVCAIFTACTNIMSSLSLPTSIEEVSRGADGDAGTEAVGDKNCEAKDVATSKSSIQKETFTLAAALGCLVVCGLSCVSIEVATSMLLEVQFDWSPEAVGYAAAAGLGPTGLLSFMCILLTEFEVVRARTLVGFLLMQAVAGVAFLYDSNVIRFEGPQLLCSDFLLYPSVSVLSCIINSEVFKIATKGSELISPESAQMVVSIASEGLDLLSVASARWLLTVGGRNGYATSQAVLVGLMFVAFHSLSSEGGSEATTVDAMKAVPAGGEDAVEATAEGCAQSAPEGDRGAARAAAPEGTGTAAARLLEGAAE